MVYQRLLKLTLASVVAIAAFVNPANADEPCSMTLCMWGKVSGTSDESCNKQIKKFFSIKKTSKGAFLPNHTLDARKNALNNECPATMEVSKNISEILSKFGKLKG